MDCPISPVLFSLPGTDLEELGRKSYVIAGERGELGSRMPRRWITVANPEKSLLWGSQAMLSLYSLSGIDGRVAKEARDPSQACHLEIHTVLVAVRPHRPQDALSVDEPVALQC